MKYHVNQGNMNNGGIPYDKFSDRESPQAVLANTLVRLFRVLKAFSQCQVLLGLVVVAMGGLYLLNDGIFGKMSINIVAGCYYAISGFVGICAGASFRRGLVISYMVMCLHAAIVIVPICILTSSIAIYLDANGCIPNCKIETLTCSISCKGDPNWNWIPNEGARSIDIAQIVFASIEFILALACAIICCFCTCERFGLVDETSLLQTLRLTLEKENTIPVLSIQENTISFQQSQPLNGGMI